MPGTPLTGANVVLDPGHGGDEPGAVGPAGTTEKAVNLAIAQEAQRQLEASGATVVLTRTGDYRITLASRAAIATAPAARSCSCRSTTTPSPTGPHDGPGAETYYQIASPDSKRAAGLVYEELVRRLRRLRHRLGGRHRRRRQVPAARPTAATTTASSAAPPACRRCCPRPPSSPTRPRRRCSPTRPSRPSRPRPSPTADRPLRHHRRPRHRLRRALPPHRAGRPRRRPDGCVGPAPAADGPSARRAAARRVASVGGGVTRWGRAPAPAAVRGRRGSAGGGAQTLASGSGSGGGGGPSGGARSGAAAPTGHGSAVASADVTTISSGSSQGGGEGVAGEDERRCRRRGRACRRWWRRRPAMSTRKTASAHGRDGRRRSRWWPRRQTVAPWYASASADDDHEQAGAGRLEVVRQARSRRPRGTGWRRTANGVAAPWWPLLVEPAPDERGRPTPNAEREDPDGRRIGSVEHRRTKSPSLPEDLARRRGSKRSLLDRS